MERGAGRRGPWSDRPGITSERLYRWTIIAALHPRHPLQGVVEDGVLDVEELAQYPLAVSPRGHRTRDLVGLFQSSLRRFDVRFVSESPGALISLGHDSDVVPIIASDSTMPIGPWWPPARNLREGLPTWWPALGARSRCSAAPTDFSGEQTTARRECLPSSVNLLIGFVPRRNLWIVVPLRGGRACPILCASDPHAKQRPPPVPCSIACRTTAPTPDVPGQRQRER